MASLTHQFARFFLIIPSTNHLDDITSRSIADIRFL